ncbi:hypothetical protein [Niveibacterium sp. SC-1]|uniref:hypothetical protein n=1 Tax=Niveibacterium sp. SC-1 TaxID=3135646 RepID=UPI00311EABE0
MSYLIRDGEAELGQTALLSEPDQVADLLRLLPPENAARASLVDADATEPPAPWRMRPLRRIWLSQAKGVYRGYKYELQDGAEVLDVLRRDEGAPLEWSLLAEFPALSENH